MINVVWPLSSNYHPRFVCDLVTQWQNVYYLDCPEEVLKCLKLSPSSDLLSPHCEPAQMNVSMRR